MNRAISELSTRELILVPALISLGITLLRLVGELNRWSEVLFNREAGGPGALIGIVWLVPIFGIYFALRLNREDMGPESRGRALGFTVAGLVLMVLFVTAITALVSSSLGRIALFNLAAAISACIVYRGWPELGWSNLSYGLAARVPVAIVMLVAMSAQWGTHYELGPPGFPEMSLLPKWIWIGLLPQMVFWISFTVIVGSLFGVLALYVRRPGGQA